MKRIPLSLLFLAVYKLTQAASIYVSPSGNDSNSGSLNAPLLTVQAAVNQSQPGDIIYLRQGTYPSAEIRVTQSDITIQSYAGEWAKIVAPVNDPDIASCIWYSDPLVTNGRLENLEIIGGYFYGVSFETNWDWGVPMANRRGASDITIINCKIHDTGRDCIKIKPGCDRIQILGCELFNSGVGPSNDPQSPNAEGIDNVNGDEMTVRGCHIHHTSTSGVYAKGGATQAVIEQNLIRNTGEAGILLGFYTDAEFFDTQVNPDYYECMSCVARNNIVMETGGEGIGMYATTSSQVYHNTIVTASPLYHGAIFVSAGDIWISSSLTLNPRNNNAEIIGNIVVDQSAAGEYTVEIRPDATTGTFTMSHNLYHKTTGPAVFDDGVNWPSYDFGQWQTAGFDANSLETDPLLDANMHLTSSSPAIGAAGNLVVSDYDGAFRMGNADIGADEFGTSVALTVPPPAGVLGTGLVGGLVSRQPEMDALQVKVYPNPAAERLHWEGVPAGTRAVLMDGLGKVLAETHADFLPLQGLPQGSYQLLLMTKSETKRVQIAVIGK